MPETTEAISDSCRRRRAERRQANLRSLFFALYMSRRQVQRRTGEAVSSYSDRYDHFTFAVALLLMLFCIADAFFTLWLRQLGAVELNPILAWALHKHVLFFFLLKYSVTGLCAVVAVMHKNFRIFGFRGIHILFACIVGYACLIQYQLSMLIPYWLQFTH